MIDLRTYTNLITLKTFQERYDYLRLDGQIGIRTFGYERPWNQRFYKSIEWRGIRDHVITRDAGFDLGSDEFEIVGKILIHHMNPIRDTDLKVFNPKVIDPEFLISVSVETHRAIHFGSRQIRFTKLPVNRKPGDTKLW